jgi:hypothetical protein
VPWPAEISLISPVLTMADQYDPPRSQPSQPGPAGAGSLLAATEAFDPDGWNGRPGVSWLKAADGEDPVTWGTFGAERGAPDGEEGVQWMPGVSIKDLA